MIATKPAHAALKFHETTLRLIESLKTRMAWIWKRHSN